MVRVILIRPGKTDFDDQGRIEGNLDIPLNALGNDQIARTANELSGESIQVVYTSPGQSAEQTARLLCDAWSVKQKTVNRLANLNHGLWQGKLIKEVKSTQKKVYRKWREQPDTVCPPEGETVVKARQRVRTALEKILKKHKNGVVAVVVPEPLASIVRSYLEGAELSDLWKTESDCGSWQSIEVHPEQILASS